MDSVSTKSVLLTWTHYRTLLQVDNDGAREWYARETAKEMWSVRTLQRNISLQYYFRLLQSQHKDLVGKEMKALTAPLQGDKLEFIGAVVCSCIKNKDVPRFFTNRSVTLWHDIRG